MIRNDSHRTYPRACRGLMAVASTGVVVLGLICSAAARAAEWELSDGPIQPNDLYGVWGSGPNDVFAVGASGTIVHYDGVNWSVMTSGTSFDLRGVSGCGPNDVFAVGSGGTILRYDGANWSTMTSGTGNELRSVWGSGPNDVFAVGAGGTILHYDGADWSAMTSDTGSNLYGVWGSGPNDVFAVGSGGTILHYDGADWSAMTSGTSGSLRGVWGSGPNEVFAVSGWALRRYDGVAWSTSSDPDLLDYAGVSGSGPNDVYAVGQCGVDGEINQYAVGVIRHDTDAGSSVTQTVEYPILNAVWASGPNDVFVVGNGGAILHSDGSGWSKMSLGETTTDLLGVWGTSSLNVLATGGFQTGLHYDGADWSRLHLGYHHSRATSYALWGHGVTAFASVIYRWYGWNPGSEHWIMVSGGGDFVEFGQDWEEVPAPHANAGIVIGSSQCGLIIVAEGGCVVRYCSDPDHDEWGWSSMPSGTGEGLHDIWGYEGDLYIVGNTGTLLHYGGSVGLDYDGSAWTAIASGTGEDLHGVWASSPNDWFVVGSGGTILHNDGTDWSPLASGTTENLNDVWGSGPNDVFAVGDNGTALHYDGATWSAMTSGTTADLNGLWGSGVNDVFAVGDNGTILRYHHLKITVEIPRPDLGSVAVYYGRDSYGVTLTPRPNANARFSHWTGDVPTGQEADDPMTMALEHDSTVTAVFIEQYDLTVLVDGEGSVDPNAGTYDEGAEPTLTATPANGWHFVEWQGDLTGSANPAPVIMNADRTITAVFEQNPPGQHALTVIVQGQGSVDPNGGTYDDGTQLILTATPTEGWRFVEWQGDMPGPANPAALTMNADKTITAVFAERPPTPCTLPCLAAPAMLTLLGMVGVMCGLRRRLTRR